MRKQARICLLMWQKFDTIFHVPIFHIERCSLISQRQNHLYFGCGHPHFVCFRIHRFHDGLLLGVRRDRKEHPGRERIFLFLLSGRFVAIPCFQNNFTVSLRIYAAGVRWIPASVPDNRNSCGTKHFDCAITHHYCNYNCRDDVRIQQKMFYRKHWGALRFNCCDGTRFPLRDNLVYSDGHISLRDCLHHAASEFQSVFDYDRYRTRNCVVIHDLSTIGV